MAHREKLPALHCTIYPWPWVIALTALNLTVGVALVLHPEILLQVAGHMGLTSSRAARLAEAGWSAVIFPLVILDYAAICHRIEPRGLTTIVWDLESVPDPTASKKWLAFQPLALTQIALIFLPMIAAGGILDAADDGRINFCVPLMAPIIIVIRRYSVVNSWRLHRPFHGLSETTRRITLESAFWVLIVGNCSYDLFFMVTPRPIAQMIIGAVLLPFMLIYIRFLALLDKKT